MNSFNQKALSLLGIGLPLCALSNVVHTNLVVKLLMTFTSVGLIFSALILILHNLKLEKEKKTIE
jgi:hypothetical protein